MAENLRKEVPSRNPLAMFAAYPVGISFAEQEEREKIILLLRAHIITLVPAVFVILFLFFLPLFIGGLLASLQINFLEGLSGGQIFLLGAFWYILIFGLILFRFIMWYFNVYLVTNERIIDFDFRGILDKQVAFTTLNHIEDITPKTIGFFGTFFDYGNVYIQTAAEKPEFDFEKVPRPDDVAHLILQQVRLEEEEQPGEIA